jgi:hypothetical protein
VRVCSLSFQHTLCTRRNVSVACLTVFRFYSSSHKRARFSKKRKKLLNIKCVFRLSLQLLSETFLILGRTERDVIKMQIGLQAKLRLLLSDFN